VEWSGTVKGFAPDFRISIWKQILLFGIPSHRAFVLANRPIHPYPTHVNILLDRAFWPWVGDFRFSKFMKPGAMLKQLTQVSARAYSSTDRRGEQLRCQS
jgi:hypothetical protein